MFKKKQAVDLTQGSPIKTIFLFAIPIMLGNVFQQFYNMVDSIVVGKFVGPEALGAVGGTFSAVFVLSRWQAVSAWAAALSRDSFWVPSGTARCAPASPPA